MRRFPCLLALAALSLTSACRKQNPMSETAQRELEAKIARFAPAEIGADVWKLPESERRALDKIIEAAKWMDPLYLRQVWRGNPDLEARLSRDTSPAGKARLRYFRINFGPWSRLDGNQPFLEGVPAKPPHAGFYPDGITRDEFNAWLKTLPKEQADKATGYFHVIRRDGEGRLKPIPYSEEYREFLEPAAALLREAASLTTNASLRAYLEKRADAFLSNDYYPSDIAWMDLDSPIEPAIGPYETYEDELFNYKAAFEAYVALRDDAETEKLAKFSGYLQEIENHLPVEARHRNPNLGPSAPIRVVQLLYSSGDGRCGVQTAAFNLPNDERVIRAKGAKRVMLKNVQEAKFNRILLPIARKALGPEQMPYVTFEAFFTHVLAHELAHGLGPHNIRAGGRATTVRLQLKELYSAIEEAKADALGLFTLQYLIDKGILGRKLEPAMYTTFLAGMFRSVRFGINEAHGKGVAIQFNYLADQGAIPGNEELATFAVHPVRFKEAVRKLTGELLTIEAEGSYEKAKALVEKYAVIRPEMQKALDNLAGVPVDIEPRFTIAPAQDAAAAKP